jgi:hypothetical protein
VSSDIRPGDYVWAPCGFSWVCCRVLAAPPGEMPLLRTKSGFTFKQSVATHPRQPALGEKLYDAIFRRSELVPRAAA